jgi:hypothetical protein
MAGSKLNNYSSTDNNITQMQLTEDASFIGKHNLTLTNMSTTSIPAIAAGSIIECNGALYKFSTEEAISTAGVTSTDGTYFIKVIPTSSQITAAFSTVAPVFRDSLQGWYESTSSNDRYAHFSVYSTGSSFKKAMMKPSGSRFFNMISALGYNSTQVGFFNFNSTVASGSAIFYDFLSEISSENITFKTSGFYSIRATFSLSAGAGGANNRGEGTVYINSTTATIEPSVLGFSFQTQNSDPFSYVITKNYSLFLSAGDYLKFYGSMGGSNGTQRCYIEIQESL